MGYDLLRKGRFSESNRVYFVTTVTQGRTKIFENFYCARILINTMRSLEKQGFVTSLSFVVMPDHLHWLFQLSDKATLSEVIKRLKAVSAQQVNKHLDRQGGLWQKAYYDRAVRDGDNLRQLSRYIVANPLRAGLVDEIAAYPHWDACWI